MNRPDRNARIKSGNKPEEQRISFQKKTQSKAWADLPL